MKKYQNYILDHQFLAVGAEMTDEILNKNRWYSLYEWSEEHEAAFEDWMVDYLRSNEEARREIMARPTKARKELMKLAREWSMQFGWRLTLRKSHLNRAKVTN